uniref:Uncharacterized protein n=1 Tax=Anguilla anguilla TaxID=7936 RepID=A0A0E9VFH8_ANGAN
MQCTVSVACLLVCDESVRQKYPPYIF